MQPPMQMKPKMNPNNLKGNATSGLLNPGPDSNAANYTM